MLQSAILDRIDGVAGRVNPNRLRLEGTADGDEFAGDGDVLTGVGVRVELAVVNVDN